MSNNKYDKSYKNIKFDKILYKNFIKFNLIYIPPIIIDVKNVLEKRD